MDDLLTIGQLARRSGLPVRTLRFWSDEGLVPPAGRSASGYRLYDAEGVARAELVRTLRELGLPLEDVGRVLDGTATVAEVARTHVAALDAQIRALKVSRAVLSTVSHRDSTAEETALMNRLARLSTPERLQIIDDFKADVFEDLDPELRDRVRRLRIDLPDDPSPDQVDAWIELAELVQDPDFRTHMRVFLELNTATSPSARIWWARQIVGTVAEARRDGIPAGTVVAGLFDPADLPAVLAGLEAGIAADAERYRLLVARVRGQHSAPDATDDLRWLAAALRELSTGNATPDSADC